MPDRAEMLDRLRSGRTWDLVVIGGGATGLGSALDAANRGYETLLLEARDFSQGTSSRSTKLVHGGVRYLAQGRIGLVREALRERGRLLRNAPHLVHPLAFLIPAYDRWSIPYYGLGLRAYDWLSGRLGLGATRTVKPSEALRLVPTLRTEGLRGGVLYQDAQFDDSRLVIALLRTFLELGGTALNHLPVEGFSRRNGRISGVQARDAETGETFEVESRAVVNATGVFADDLRRLDEPGAVRRIRPSQGVHLVLDGSFLPGEAAVMIPKTDDGRVLFAIPWRGRTLIGTTDTPVEEVTVEPRPLAEELEFLIGHAGRYLSRAPAPGDVLSLFTGLRPLVGSGEGGSTSGLSRDHALMVSDSGLVTITGGKWTTYRLMGADAVDRAAEVAGLPRRACQTEELRLHGWREGDDPGPFSIYGSDAKGMEELLAEHPEWDRPLHPRLPHREVEVVWAARQELARTVEDVLSRRLRSLLLDAGASLEAAPRVAELLAEELGFDTAWRQQQETRFSELVKAYQWPAG
ncbi:glycerol-3-phosphate dehydrogenase/oxidase [soil metagenome]